MKYGKKLSQVHQDFLFVTKQCVVIDEHSEFSVDVNVSPQFFVWIFGLGNDVKIIGSADAVEDMKKQVE